jgi:HK97 family phage major capsid protein
MKTVKQLQEERGAIQAQINAITDKAKAEARSVSDAELTEMQGLAEQREAKDREISAAQFLKEEELRRAADEARNNPNFNIGGDRNKGGEEGEQSKLRKHFRYTKLIAAGLETGRLDGAEAEIVKEGHSEARARGVNPQGMAIPSFMVGNARPNMGEQRADLTVGTDATAGYLVDTSIGEVIEHLYPTMVLQRAGARVLSGLTGNVDLIRQDGRSAATWEGENDDAAQTNPTYESVALRPKRLAAFAVYGKQLIQQVNVISVENEVRRDIGMAVGEAVDIAGLNGATGGSNPVGLLKTSGIGSVQMGTNGAAIDWASLMKLKREVAKANGMTGRMAYVTNPDQVYAMETTKKDSGSGIFLIENGQVGGYPVYQSTLVPNNLTKGTASGVCSAIIFGDFAQLYIAQWAGLDFVVDPYSLAGKAQVKVTINSWWDIAVRQKKAFAAILDAL